MIELKEKKVCLYNEVFKQRRISKFKEVSVNKLSAVTRKLFKKWNIRKAEISNYEKSVQYKVLQKQKRVDGLLKQCKCGRKFDYICQCCLDF